MKERITYIHGSDEVFEPSQLRVSQNSLEIANLKAARDHHLTFELEELPQELRLVLEQFYEFHLRWSSVKQTELLDPFSSRISPGLHIFSSPKQRATIGDVCPLLHEILGKSLKCISQRDSFTSRESMSRQSPGSTVLEYHGNLQSLDDLAVYGQEKLCQLGDDSCRSRIEILRTADSLDIDFASQMGKVFVRAYHSSPVESSGWTVNDALIFGSSRTEVGVLATQDATERDQVKMGGYLVVLREDTKLKPTLFQFPSRHHQPPSLTSHYGVTFSQPSGLHPTMRIDMVTDIVPRTAKPDSCSLYTYLTLPSTIFPDKYQLSNELLLESLNIRAVRAVSGYTDLEAPDYAVSAWGSSMLIELARPEQLNGKQRDRWHADIPLHLRYLPPSNVSSGTSSVKIPWPVVFWACNADAAIGRLSGNPFDRTHLGYDSHFSDKTIFHHLRPESEHKALISTLQVPVLNTSLLGKDARLLDLGTGFVILVGWLWIVWLLFKGFWWTKTPAQSRKKND